MLAADRSVRVFAHKETVAKAVLGRWAAHNIWALNRRFRLMPCFAVTWAICGAWGVAAWAGVAPGNGTWLTPFGVLYPVFGLLYNNMHVMRALICTFEWWFLGVQLLAWSASMWISFDGRSQRFFLVYLFLGLIYLLTLDSAKPRAGRAKLLGLLFGEGVWVGVLFLTYKDRIVGAQDKEMVFTLPGLTTTTMTTKAVATRCAGTLALFIARNLYNEARFPGSFSVIKMRVVTQKIGVGEVHDLAQAPREVVALSKSLEEIRGLGARYEPRSSQLSAKGSAVFRNALRRVTAEPGVAAEEREPRRADSVACGGRSLTLHPRQRAAALQGSASGIAGVLGASWTASSSSLSGQKVDPAFARSVSRLRDAPIRGSSAVSQSRLPRVCMDSLCPAVPEATVECDQQTATAPGSGSNGRGWGSLEDCSHFSTARSSSGAEAGV
mmetsp:Transcript_4207/g.9838  ORF Transcript_4207/g.9838 Transcript_4207/m.9838 type:complete len:439 (-) Transcript_4207:244-1560(-)